MLSFIFIPGTLAIFCTLKSMAGDKVSDLGITVKYCFFPEIKEII
jgi:hypothetical protein